MVLLWLTGLPTIISQSTSTTVAPVAHMESICIRVQAWMSRLIKMLTANNTSSTI